MLVRIPPRSDDGDFDLIRLSRENPGFRVEREADGTITMSPTAGFGGAASGKAFRQLDEYADKYGGVAFDSNQGWKLRDPEGPGTIDYSPDASWIDEPTAASIPDAERESSRILAVVPTVAIEVRSPSDSWSKTVRKLDVYQFNGTMYAVAINRQTREVIELGTPPPGLKLDFEAIIAAGRRVKR